MFLHNIARLWDNNVLGGKVPMYCKSKFSSNLQENSLRMFACDFKSIHLSMQKKKRNFETAVKLIKQFFTKPPIAYYLQTTVDHWTSMPVFPFSTFH